MTALKTETSTKTTSKIVYPAPENGRNSPPTPGANERPTILDGGTVKMRTVNRLGLKFYELFSRAGRAGGCAASPCEAIGRLVSLARRKGASAEEVVEQLRGITCQRKNEKDSEQARPCADGVANAIKIA